MLKRALNILSPDKMTIQEKTRKNKMELNHDNSQIWLTEGLNQKLDAINTKLTKLDLIHEKVSTIEDTITSMQRSVEVAMIIAEEAKHEAINSKKQFIDLQQAYENVQAEKVLIQVKLDSIFEKQLSMECQSRRSNLNLDNVPEKNL